VLKNSEWKGFGKQTTCFRLNLLIRLLNAALEAQNQEMVALSDPVTQKKGTPMRKQSIHHSCLLKESSLTIANKRWARFCTGWIRTAKNNVPIVMKKHLLFALLLAFSAVAMAQSKISYGVRAGIIQSTMRGDAVNNFQDLLTYTGGAVTAHSKTGFYTGGFVSIPVSETVSIEPGINYAQKGYELKGSLGIKGTDIIGGRSRLTLSYVEVPLLAKANLNGLQLFAGPQFGYLAGANLHTTAGILGFALVNDRRDVKDQFNDVDVSLTGGIGYQFRNGFSVNAAYDHGLSKVNSGRSIEAYNQAMKLGVGFRF
jgi:hypothetical protein